VNPVDTVPLMLLALHLLALGVGTIIFFGMILLHRRDREMQRMATARGKSFFPGPVIAPGPAAWLAVRSTDSRTVLTALGLSCPVPCSWQEGLTGDCELFIGPPVNGWMPVFISWFA
jgi:hypothetical protein